MFEFIYFPKLKEKDLNSLVKFNNHKLVDKSTSTGKGTFFLSGHLSNWELTAFAYSSLYNSSLKIIAKEQASKSLNKKINVYRSMSGNEIIEIGYSLRKVYEELKKNEIVCFLVDQSANPEYSVYVNFFGQKVATFSGPAKIALKYRPGLMVAYGIRNSDYTYSINFEEIKYDDLITNSHENIWTLTQRIQSRFEDIIRSHPGQWLWFHKRFKHMKREV